MTGEEQIRAWRSKALEQVRVRLPVHLGLSPVGVDRLRSKMPTYIIGADEVGRGALAGPVTVCAFLAPATWRREGLKDSKKHTVAERAALYGELSGAGLGHHIAELSNQYVDDWGMTQCLNLLFEECLEQLRERFPAEFENALIVLDGNQRARYVDHIALPKADDIVQHVSAASVLAKFHRDRYMATEAHLRYPAYGFDTHVGYGTPKHRAVIGARGPCPLHRKSFLDNESAWRQ